MKWKEIQLLIKKDMTLEWRNKYAFNGIILYVATTIFVCYLSFNVLEDASVWSALFWIIMLFSATNAFTKSFSNEGEARHIYYYSLCSPQSVILAKIIYNAALIILIALISFFFYTLLLGDLIIKHDIFICGLLLGSIGLSSVLTFISAIAGKTKNNVSLMAILSFPVLLPLLLCTLQVSKAAMSPMNMIDSGKYLLVLGLINVLVIVLSYLLFPYLWRD